MSLTRKEIKRSIIGKVSNMKEVWINFLFGGSYRDLEISIETEDEDINLSVSPEEPFETSHLYNLYEQFNRGEELKVQGEIYERSYGLFPFYFLRGPTDFIGKIQTSDGRIYKANLWEGARAREFYNGRSFIVEPLL